MSDTQDDFGPCECGRSTVRGCAEMPAKHCGSDDAEDDEFMDDFEASTVSGRAYLNAAAEADRLRTQLKEALKRESGIIARYDARIVELEVSNLQTRRDLKRLWALARGNDPDDTEEGPRCRDCADMDGVCHSGLPCNPQKRAEVQIIQIRAENARLRAALRGLLDCPAISDGSNSDPTWGCQESLEAERRAREALKETK